jgi:CheY-like chemotaxis protein
MMKVLYVEDDRASRDVMRMAQRMNPDMLDLTVLEDSSDFEQRFLEIQPELILLDIHVKPLTGFEMLKIVRAHSGYDAVPVVALTASVMSEEVELLKSAGFQGIVSKPLDLDEFPALVEKIMAGERIWYIW